MLKSIWAVLAGFLLVFVLSVVTDTILEKLGIFPTQSEPTMFVTWMLTVALVYRSLYTVVGGYVVARLAPKNAMKHVVALMILGGVGGVVGAIGGWNLSAHWYPISLAVTGPLFVFLGGKFYTNSLVKKVSA